MYKDGNTFCHKLAEQDDFETAKQYLRCLEEIGTEHHQKALNATNRKGKTVFSLAQSHNMKHLLQWSESQEGFYYLSTAPVVVLMYSSMGRSGAYDEAEIFSNYLQYEALDIAPIVRVDPTTSVVLETISDAIEMHPSMSALMVVQMSHGTFGSLRTTDGSLRIDAILRRMPHNKLDNKHKVKLACIHVYADLKAVFHETNSQKVLFPCSFTIVSDPDCLLSCR